MFKIIKKMVIELLSFGGTLASMPNVSKFTACIFLNNQPCMAGSTLIDFNLDEYNQGLCHYPFIINLDRCDGGYNTFDDQ